MPVRERLKRFQRRFIDSLETLFPTDDTAPPLSAPDSERDPRKTASLLLPSPRARPSSINQPAAVPSDAEDGGTDKWPRLRSFLRMLDRSPLAFGPLNVVIAGLVECVEIYEEAANNNKVYDKLRIELETVFGNLEQFTPADSLVMTASMEGLCRSVQKELDYLKGKQDRGTLKRHLEAGADLEDVLACYQRIHIYLQRLSLNVNLSIWRIMDEQVTDARLDRLCPSMSACYNSSQALQLKRGACTPGTRINVLGQMHTWIHSPSNGSVYWLNGMAGTGKTTIAYSLCIKLDADHQLGASFFCSRILPECRDVNLIIPSIAYQLAQFSRPFRSALSRVLEKERNVHTRLIQIQFENLIVKPLAAVQETLPEGLVVVIDALDECDDRQSTSLILDTLFTKAVDLPIKFFVSSRPEPEIRDQMQKQGDNRASSRLVLHELDTGTVQGDIEKYLRQALAPIHPTEPQLRTLVQRGGILFIYAATVARYIGHDNFRRNPHDRLETILSVSTVSGSNPYKDIDELYTVILRAAVDDPDLSDTERDDIKQVLYTVVCSREPLTIEGLSGLLGLHKVERVRAALRPLWSVLHVVEMSDLVTTLHASFPDYLFDPRRSGEYQCDSAAHERTLTQRCFDCIESAKPRFNICGLESSYVLDRMIPDLDARVEKAISPELAYACRYWASHLERVEGSAEVLGRLFDFLSARLLLWMEIMNLKKCMHSGVGVLGEAERWCKRQSCSEGLMQLMHDSWRFVAAFTSGAVSQSTPHIYVSMLPFWPEYSPIAKHYAKRMRAPSMARGPAIARRRLELLATWPVDGEVSGLACSPDGARIALAAGGKIVILDGLTGRVMMGPLAPASHSVRSIGYSRNGTRIASGSEEGAIWLWDAERLENIVGSLTGHTKAVNSVAFSPNGTLIVSGSADNTVRVWDVQSRQMMLGPLKGHSRLVTSVGFSPDGTRIVSGSYDNTVRVWDVQSGRTVLGPLEGHTNSVTSVGFSPDGTFIVSGSRDKTIRMWGIKSGQVMLGPLEGHSSWVTSVMFSCDGSRIVSGSYDGTIRVWDINSGQMVLGPLEGHTSWVTWVEFSPDSTRIVSGSADMTIRVWDIECGHTVLRPLEGHTSSVVSVAFSPDGTRIVSGSYDRTIWVWDIQSGRAVLGPLEGHTNLVLSVGFSPDGTHLVSGSSDNTIRVWDVHSGQTVLGPFEGHAHSVMSVGFSPDGTYIVSGSADRTIRVWDVRSRRAVLGPLEGHAYSVTSVGFSPNGNHIVSGSYDGTIRVWDIRSEQAVFGPLEGHTSWVTSVGFSHDGARIISGSTDKTIRVWDVQSRQTIIGPLTGHSMRVNSIGVSPDGSRIVSGSDDKTLCIWDAESGQIVLGPLEGHSDSVFSVGFSPDGTQVVSGSADKTIRVWDVRRGPVQPPNSALPTPVLWQIDSNGWVTDDQSRLFVWVPPDLHRVLLGPRIVFDSSPDHVRLNFDNVNVGESWVGCYQPV